MRVRSLLFGLAVVGLSACSSSSTSGGAGAFSDTDANEAIITNYVDQVIVPTYQLLATRTSTLVDAVQTLNDTPTAENLTAAQEAWVNARVPWEQSEAFLFGPVDTNGFDPALDSWPVNQTDLDAVLASSDALTTDYVSNLDPTLKGFHTIEYLLFGAGKTRTVGELDARKLEYLLATAQELSATAAQLVSEWTTGGTPFATIFKTAGEGNSTYPSLANAAEEMVRALIAITDEVANGKIADPFDQQDTQLVESQFAFNSVDDFANNIRGVEFVYHGDQETAGTTGTGLDEFVRSVDPELDEAIHDDIHAAIAAIEAIPYPFRDAILDPANASVIRAAQDAIRVVKDRLETEVLPLVTE